ncbi:MAG TPA: AAA domain-containing protein [Polyangiaceae bacterium LLY-WYZ-15_(1-7)]|nr:AAA domain-containing protein [Polyangiaceae bacterium LLY-WYZ-15_(1-7)]HJL06621.1 AAA domain-containing protein [Polyangiaceae bacterium LLY-WYZ-15_(1-7)]HJL09227.1 AAA domain-containing protein [Polyangiaceae bacterium LLY-WYZ-15_(1-7)]HJL28040.1 AAA domain-containing protein [Polyangiaceae bacterium LLY-WYZ-15_(1-7)]
MDTTAPQVPADVVAEVETLFCGPGGTYGNYSRPPDDRGEVVIPTALYRFTLLDPDSQRVTLQVYKDIDSIGGALWTREVRTLLRVSVRQHPALPRILAGAYVEKNDLAFVITEAAQYRLSDKGAMGFVASDREQAVRQLTLLAHGLSLLHEQGITHGNLHPGAVEYVEFGHVAETDEVRFGLRLSGFEMSAMVSNLVRRQLAGEQLPTGDMRRIYLDAADQTLAYCPPERVAWLLADDTGELGFESDRSDIYSLGILAWRWLVESGSTEDRSYEEDRIAWAGLERSVESIKTLHGHMLARLRDPKIPATFAQLLRSMLAWDPRDRPSIFAVLRELTQDYGRLVASMAPAEEARTFYVGFMPEESKKTIYRWGWVDLDPTEEEGREQLRAFLESELRGAEILYCPEGFSGYQRARDDRELRAFQAAKYVLAGKQAYWFCDIYCEPGPAYNRQDRLVEQVLLIKYVRHHQRAWRLGELPLRRRIPGELRLLPIWARRVLDLSEARSEGATWRPVLRSVEFERTTPDWMLVMDDALSFLLAFKNAELDARIFPFEVRRQSGTLVDLRVDQSRDRKRQYEDGLRSLYYREMRVPMGRLFDGLDSEGTTPLAVYGDINGKPDFRGRTIAKVVLNRRLDDDTVQVRLLHGARNLPEIGWIRPDEDHGSFFQLRRQEDAVQELLQARALLHQLHGPSAIKGIRARWRGVGDHLKGRSAGIVKDMLSSEPFYALHGPPGTGKTTVASVAVAAHLRSDRSQRVLISSQSHFALDNLAVRVLARCRDDNMDIVAVRIASDHAVAEKKVHPRLEALRPERQASAKVDGIKRACRAALDDGQLQDGRQLDAGMKALLGEWMEQAPRVELEVQDRIRRGANLVFATTGGCTEQNVATGGTAGLYDWVVVEEAARAWPTELALPLVRGLRWTLIGDHFQLPAFDELSVQRFLQLCSQTEDEELQLHGTRAKEYQEVFRLFGSLFDNRAQRREARPKTARLIEPLDELDLQFRMHPDICRLVSRAFYRERVDPDNGELTTYQDGWLRTDEETTAQPHLFTHPGFLKNRALVWLDTQGVEDTNDQRAWKNEGEAQLVRQLLEQMRPTPALPSRQDDDDIFALLTPYHAQRGELERAGLPEWAKGRIHTVDSFQGREADTVVVSLVRSTQRDDRRPEANIGYLVSPNRTNVLLSRARKLLIIVGRLAHFEKQAALNPDRKDILFWRSIVEEVRRQGAVVSAASAFAGGLR